MNQIKKCSQELKILRVACFSLLMLGLMFHHGRPSGTRQPAPALAPAEALVGPTQIGANGRQVPVLPVAGPAVQTATNSSFKANLHRPTPAPPHLQALGRVMNEMLDAMASETKAASVLDDYMKCVLDQDPAHFGSVHRVCAHNAELIGQKYPALRMKAQRIVSKSQVAGETSRVPSAEPMSTSPSAPKFLPKKPKGS